MAKKDKTDKTEKQALTNAEIIAYIPVFVKGVSLEKKDDITFIKKENDHKIQRFARKIKIRLPEYTSIELDPFGTCVVENINGENSIKDIAKILAETYPETLEQQYNRLLLYLTRLEQEFKFIEFL